MKVQQFSQIGKRQNNEDSLGSNANILTVCDGMGGHICGERASGYVVSSLLEHFANPIEDLNKMVIQEHLDAIQHGLNHILDQEPELEKMGTTFTGIFPTKDFWYAAYIGDSRIYLFRPAERKLWHTWDHSLVGELMRNGEITREAGRHHPMSNRIGKAIIANHDDNVAKASVFKIDDLREGDIFLLCSDGVVEAWGDHELCQLFFDTTESFEVKCEKLRQQCNLKSSDNNTALMIQIEASDAFSYGNNEELTWFSEQEIFEDYKKYLKKQAEEAEVVEVKAEPLPSANADAPKPRISVPKMKPKQGPNNQNPNWFQPRTIFVIALALILLTGLLFMKFCSGKGKKQETPIEINNAPENPGENPATAPAESYTSPRRNDNHHPNTGMPDNSVPQNTDPVQAGSDHSGSADPTSEDSADLDATPNSTQSDNNGAGILNRLTGKRKKDNSTPDQAPSENPNPTDPKNQVEDPKPETPPTGSGLGIPGKINVVGGPGNAGDPNIGEDPSTPTPVKPANQEDPIEI